MIAKAWVPFARLLRTPTEALKACISVSIGILLLNHLYWIQQSRAKESRLLQELMRVSRLPPADQLEQKLGDFRVKDLNCMRLIGGDSAELRRGLKLSHDVHYVPASDYHYLTTVTCTHYLSKLVTATLSEDEANFPLAFSIVVYKDFHQVLRLLRAIYRPEHSYCLHVDRNSSPWFKGAVNAFANCLPNVVVAYPSVRVQWSRFSTLEADLLCWQLLMRRFPHWRYLINLTGQEFPLRTMRETVGILRNLRGANSIENTGTIKSYSVPQIPGSNSSIVWHKGSVHVVVCRGFVQFAFSQVGTALQANLRRQDAERQREPPADEVLFATLNYNSPAIRVPGAPIDSALKTDNVALPYLPRYKNWLTGLFGYPCLSGKTVRGICIWGLADLPAMNRRPELFANKFFEDFQPLTLACLEERFWHNTLADYALLGLNKTWEISLTAFSNYSFVTSHT